MKKIILKRMVDGQNAHFRAEDERGAIIKIGPTNGKDFATSIRLNQPVTIVDLMPNGDINLTIGEIDLNDNIRDQ